MRFFLAVLSCIFFLNASAQKQTITKDSSFSLVKKLMEDRPFVVSGAVYKIYDMKLSGCILEYKVHFQDQDSLKNKISVHRSYAVNLSQLNPAYTKTLITGTSWVILKTRPGGLITESILPEPKKNAIPKPVIKRDVSQAFLPVEFNDPKYEAALNNLIFACSR